MTTSNVSFDLIVDGAVIKTGERDEISGLMRSMSSQFAEKGERRNVFMSRHHEVSGERVTIDRSAAAKALHGEQELIRAQEAAYRKYQRAGRVEQTELVAAAAEALLNFWNTKKLDIPNMVLRGETLRRGQIKWLIERAEELRITGA